jgi:hypothetical protein
MFCQNCGSSNEPQSKFCIKCGGKLSGAGSDAASSSTLKNRTDDTAGGGNDGYNPPKPTFQNQGGGSGAGSNPNDVPSCGIGLLCFIWPMIGLILYIVWRDTKPRAAKSAGMYALASVIVGIVAVFLYFIFIVLIFGSMYVPVYGANFVADALNYARFAIG